MAVCLMSSYYYTVFHYGTADHGGSPFKVFIIIQYFTTGLRTVVAVQFTPLSYNFHIPLLWDCRLR